MKSPQKDNCPGLQHLNSPEIKKDKLPYLCPEITLHLIQLDFKIMVGSTFIRTGGPGNAPRVEDWEDEGESIKDFDF